MEAVVWTRYGGPEVLEPRVLPTPSPGPDDLLVRVHASTVTTGDTELRDLSLPLWPLRLPMRLAMGLRRPRGTRVLGMEVAGVVEAVGHEVDRFAVGDAVLAHTGLRFGGNATHVCLAGDGLVVRRPDGLSFADAAALPNGGLEAISLVRRSRVGPGQRVAVVGAGGSIGTLLVQLAAGRGAEVTAVDGEDKLAMLRGLGAAHVVDFRREDVTAGGPWDVVFDVPGVTPFGPTLASVAPTGTYVIANPVVGTLARGLVAGRRGPRRVLFFATDQSVEDLQELADLAGTGALRVVVDRTWPLAEAADAHRYVASGRKQGNVVLLSA